MKLLLVRHAIAHDRDAARWPDDSLRPLTPAGRRKFAESCNTLARFKPTIVFSSPYTRAMQTAKLLAKHAAWPKPQQMTELQPDATATQTVAALAQCEADTVAMVGHEPTLSLLAAHLLGTRVMFEFKKGGAARIEFNGHAKAGAGKLIWLATPALLLAER